LFEQHKTNGFAFSFLEQEALYYVFILIVEFYIQLVNFVLVVEFCMHLFVLVVEFCIYAFVNIILVVEFCIHVFY